MRARVKVRVKGGGALAHLLLVEAEDFPVEAEVRLEDVEVSELDGGVLERIVLLAHRARRAQRERLVLGQAEELPVLGDVERGRLAARDGLLLLLLGVLRDDLRAHLGRRLADAVGERHGERLEELARHQPVLPR